MHKEGLLCEIAAYLSAGNQEGRRLFRPKKGVCVQIKGADRGFRKEQASYQFLHFLHAVIPYTMKSREYLNHFTHEDLSHHVD